MCLSLFSTEENDAERDPNQKKPLPFTRNRGYPKTASAVLKILQAVSFPLFQMVWNHHSDGSQQISTSFNQRLTAKAFD